MMRYCRAGATWVTGQTIRENKRFWNKYKRRQRGSSKDTQAKQGQRLSCEDMKKLSWMDSDTSG